MKYLIYVAVSLIVIWALYTVFQHLRRMARGEGCTACHSGCKECGARTCHKQSQTTQRRGKSRKKQ